MITQWLITNLIYYYKTICTIIVNLDKRTTENSHFFLFETLLNNVYTVFTLFFILFIEDFFRSLPFHRSRLSRSLPRVSAAINKRADPGSRRTFIDHSGILIGTVLKR